MLCLRWRQFESSFNLFLILRARPTQHCANNCSTLTLTLNTATNCSTCNTQHCCTMHIRHWALLWFKEQSTYSCATEAHAFRGHSKLCILYIMCVHIYDIRELIYTQTLKIYIYGRQKLQRKACIKWWWQSTPVGCLAAGVCNADSAYHVVYYIHVLYISTM